MQGWHAFPFFRFIIPFATGILLAIYTDFSIESSGIELLVATAVAFLPVLFTYFFNSFRFRWLSGLAAYVFLSIAGYSLTVIHTPKYDPLNISNFKGSPETSLIRIIEPFTVKEKSLKTVGEFVAVYDSSEFVKTSGKVLMYFEKSPAALALQYGDEILVHSAVKMVDPPGNPHQFNYKAFLANSGIYHQVYIKNNQWNVTGNTRRNPVFQFATAARDKMLGLLQGLGLDGDEFSVASAILLGYDEYMDRELRDKYAGAGALHVLCVSGLHVGIIFLFLNVLFKPLDRKKSLRIVKVILVLTTIWIYACITGLSPSVMRAALMFSLFAIRDVRKDKSNPYNILAASAFILLVIDPYMITKIGFQLSYAAVIAIISLYQPIYSLMPVKGKIPDYFWKLTVISLAAQIGTFPFAIYYFHQFPVYFFLTNLVVIPLVWLILTTGIVVLVISTFLNLLQIHTGLVIISYPLNLMLEILNAAVSFIDALPGARLTGLVLSLVQLILIYSIIIMISRAFLLRRSSLLMWSLACMLLLFGSFVFRKFDVMTQQNVVVYQVNGHSGIEFYGGGNATLLADTALLHDTRSIDFCIAPNRTFSGVKHTNAIPLLPKETDVDISGDKMLQCFEPCFYAYGDFKLAVIDKDFEAYKPESPILVDVAVLRNNPEISIPELKTRISFKYLVFDASNNFWTAQKWKASCDSLMIAYHDVKLDGFFNLDF